MTPSEKDQERAAIARYGGIADRLAGDVWGIEADGGPLRLTSRRSSGEVVTLCTIGFDCLAHEQDLICSGFEILLMLLDFKRRAAATIHELQGRLDQRERRAKASDYAAQAAMLLDNPTFRRFLEGKGAGGPVRDKQAADTRLKSVLAIRSKSEINNDDRARRAFLSLRADFDAWKRGLE